MSLCHPGTQWLCVAFFSGFSVNGEKRQTPSDDGRGLPDAKFVGGWVRGGSNQLTSKDGVVVEEEVLLRRFGR